MICQSHRLGRGVKGRVVFSAKRLTAAENLHPAAKKRRPLDPTPHRRHTVAAEAGKQGFHPRLPASPLHCSTDDADVFAAVPLCWVRPLQKAE